MYVSIYYVVHVLITHAQILGQYTGKIVIMLMQVPLIVVRVIVSVITYCSSGVVGVNALLSARTMQCKKRREGTVLASLNLGTILSDFNLELL